MDSIEPRVPQLTSEMADRLVESGKFPTKKAARAAFVDLFEEIEATVMAGERVRTRLGTFSLKTRKARQGVNPATLEKIEIPETTVVVFKRSAGIKKRAKAA